MERRICEYPGCKNFGELHKRFVSLKRSGTTEFKQVGTILNTEFTKYCPKCETVKELNENNFYISNIGDKNKYSGYCKVCDNKIKCDRKRIKQKEIGYKFLSTTINNEFQKHLKGGAPFH